MNTSYSAKIKAALSEINDKKNCCRRIFGDIYKLKSVDGSNERARIIEAAPQHFKCDGCFSSFLRAMFIVFGNVTDPSKQYHLELSFVTDEERAAASAVIEGGSISMKSGERRGRFLLYIKSSGGIEDFFAAVGANRAAFELINAKILKEMRENANRQSNCDMANIKKSLSASKRYIEVIEELVADGTVVRLPIELRETAMLRVENTQASMSELALMHSAPISKSGVKHRLDRIVDLSESYKKEK